MAKLKRMLEERRTLIDYFTQAEQAWIAGEVRCGQQVERLDTLGWLLWCHCSGLLFGHRDSAQLTREERVTVVEEARKFSSHR